MPFTRASAGRAWQWPRYPQWVCGVEDDPLCEGEGGARCTKGCVAWTVTRTPAEFCFRGGSRRGGAVGGGGGSPRRP